MSSNWIKRSERVLEQIDAVQEVDGKDRLDNVRSIRFTLSAMHRRLTGWFQRVRNPDIVARFTKDDLEEMDKEPDSLDVPL